MATSRFLLAVLSVHVCLLLQDAVAIKNRRILKQLVEFKDEMRRELQNIHADIFELFESNKNRSKLETRVHPDASKDGGVIVNAEDLPHAYGKGNQDMVIKGMLQKYEHLLRAFQSEKRINRHLQQRLTSFEKRVTDQLSSAVEMPSVKEYVDQSIDKKVLEGVQIVNESNTKIADDVRNIAADFLVISENMDTIKTEVKNVSNIVKELSETVYGQRVNAMSNIVEQSFQNPHDEVETTTVVQSFQNPHGEVETTTVVHPNNCKDVPESGVYNLYFDFMQTTAPVYCDQDTDGGGWMVILRRQDGSGNFHRTWAEYKDGFGDREGEFWAGNELIHQLTISKPTQLRIDMETFDGEFKFAQYGDFQIGHEEDKYRLKISDYVGTAGDSMFHRGNYGTNNGKLFSTIDRDYEDAWFNCAEKYEGGWWYDTCGPSYLTARYSYTGDISDDRIGIRWHTLTSWRRSLKFVEMKIRDVQ